VSRVVSVWVDGLMGLRPVCVMWVICFIYL